MSCRALVLSVVAVQYAAAFAAGYDKKVFCYYESFAFRRPERGSFQPEDINPWLCTHVIYAFVDILADGTDLKPISPDDVDPRRGLYARTVSLKKVNPELRVLLAVGGWKMGSEPFLPIINSRRTMRAWVSSVVRYLRRYGFDGLDMDWEFPGIRGSTPKDKPRFTLLMKSLHEGFDREARLSGHERLTLTLATAAGGYYIDRAYETTEIARHVDYMLLMSYNYHGGLWENVTGHHSGIERHKHDPVQGTTHQQWTIDFWLAQGIPRDRLIVGIPTYGMSFTLENPRQNGVFARSVGPGVAGEYTREKGILAYYEICDRLQNRDWERRWINSQSVPYAHGGNQWVGYENRDSVRIKVKNIIGGGLGGAFVWSLTLDDFVGVCGQGVYPLLTQVSELLLRGEESLVTEGRNSPTTMASVLYTRDTQPSTEGNTTPVNTITLNKGSVVQKETVSMETWWGKWWNREERISSQRRRKVATNVTPPRAKYVFSTNAVNRTSRASFTFITSTEAEVSPKDIAPSPESGRGDVSSFVNTTITTLRRKYTRPGTWWRRFGVYLRMTPDNTKRVTSSNIIPSRYVPSLSTKPKDQYSTSHYNTSPISRIQTTDITFQTIPSRLHRDKLIPWYMGQVREPFFYSMTSETDQPPTMVYVTKQYNRNYTRDITTAIPQTSLSNSENGDAVDCSVLGIGIHGDPASCDHFYLCQHPSTSRGSATRMKCANGTRFDRHILVCNHAAMIDC